MWFCSIILGNCLQILEIVEATTLDSLSTVIFWVKVSVCQPILLFSIFLCLSNPQSLLFFFNPFFFLSLFLFFLFCISFILAENATSPNFSSYVIPTTTLGSKVGIKWKEKKKGKIKGGALPLIFLLRDRE